MVVSCTSSLYFFPHLLLQWSGELKGNLHIYNCKNKGEEPKTAARCLSASNTFLRTSITLSSAKDLSFHPVQLSDILHLAVLVFCFLYSEIQAVFFPRIIPKMEINVIKGVLKQKKEESSSHARTMCVSMREVVRLSQDFKVCHKKNRVWWRKRVIFFFSSCLTKIKNFFHLETQKKN